MMVQLKKAQFLNEEIIIEVGGKDVPLSVVKASLMTVLIGVVVFWGYNLGVTYANDQAMWTAYMCNAVRNQYNGYTHCQPEMLASGGVLWNCSRVNVSSTQNVLNFSIP